MSKKKKIVLTLKMDTYFLMTDLIQILIFFQKNKSKDIAFHCKLKALFLLKMIIFVENYHFFPPTHRVKIDFWATNLPMLYATPVC